ncbi:hypothetical protein [Cupriavidus basilensis]|uniref:hypothetical protein n=1 Tax=Cupriavidus basilensis TaxID=68895 RepID=UPI00157B8B3E|nr:hypothetical protein [Cupriavidus basilensis]NUA28422.1 hypothetical protein [Cupriavidus basilensis]
MIQQAATMGTDIARIAGAGQGRVAEMAREAPQGDALAPVSGEAMRSFLLDQVDLPAGVHAEAAGARHPGLPSAPRASRQRGAGVLPNHHQIARHRGEPSHNEETALSQTNRTLLRGVAVAAAKHCLGACSTTNFSSMDAAYEQQGTVAAVQPLAGSALVVVRCPQAITESAQAPGPDRDRRQADRAAGGQSCAPV